MSAGYALYGTLGAVAVTVVALADYRIASIGALREI